MSETSVSAIYDGKQIRLLEKVPVQGPYLVRIIFVEPARGQTGDNDRPQKLENLKGIWRGFDLSFEDIQSAEYQVAEELL